MANYFVNNSEGVNLRSQPIVRNDTKIALIPHNHLVDVDELQPTINGFYSVTVTLNGTLFWGYVKSDFLSPQQSQPSTNTSNIDEVHLEPSPYSRRNSIDDRWHPLGENDLPWRDSQNPIQSIRNILNYLNVQQSVRYKASNGATFCNIYAYDYCYLNQVYIPRVWWNDYAINEINNGNNVSPILDYTVTEKNANSLVNWLKTWGANFGWQRVYSLTELQNRANNGEICILAAKRRGNGSGHIVAVVPETSNLRAIRNSSGNVISPLYSQAGLRRDKYRNVKWNWDAYKYIEFVLFAHP